MTKTQSLLSLVLLVSAVGCARTADLGKMQEETIGVVKIYDHELVALERRAVDADKKARLMGPLISKEANQRLQEGTSAITQGRNIVTSAPTLVATAAKSGKSEELVKFNDETVEKLRHLLADAHENLDAFDTFAANAEIAPTPKTAPPAVPPTTDPNTPVANDPNAPVTPPGGNPSQIPCEAEIFLKCPEGQVDACSKGAATHGCVPQ